MSAQSGMANVLDRVLQQAIQQVLTPVFDPGLSEASHGFRTHRSAHRAARNVQCTIRGGHCFVANRGLSKFFDGVQHDILVHRVARQVHDKPLVALRRTAYNSGRGELASARWAAKCNTRATQPTNQPAGLSMATFMRIKFWLLGVVAAYAAWKGLWAVGVAHREPEPTHLAAADFDNGKYGGQQWLAVTGKVDPAEAVWAGKNMWVPLRDDVGGPVHVLVLVGKASDSDPHAKLAAMAHGPTEITGAQVFFDPDRLFPHLAKADPVVMIQEGNRPLSANSAWAVFGIFGGLFMVVVTLEGRQFYHFLRERRLRSTSIVADRY